jgi:hypothetical protein
VRFISKPVFQLPTAGIPRRPDRTQSIFVAPSTDQCSIGISIDFRSDGNAIDGHAALANEIIPWQGYVLHIQAVELPAQVATLSWFHQR